MIALPDRFVDLYTPNKRLEDLMLSEYPGKIIPEEQHYVQNTGAGTLYKFFDLNYDALIAFLKDKDNLGYIILDSETGKLLAVNAAA